MQNILIGLLLAGILAFAVYGTIKRIRFGSSCCGTKDRPEKKVKVKDKNKSHFPYRYILKVEGMHCSHCARRVENAFHRTEGRWARVDLEKKEVLLLSKQEETEEELAHITSSAGYTMKGMTGEKC